MTLVETLVGVSVGSIVIGALVAFSVYTARGFVGCMNYVELESQSRNALDTMTREIRQTVRVSGLSSNMLALMNSDSNALAYLYDPVARTLVRSNSGGQTTLLTECDSVSFSIFQRNMISNTFDQIPASLQASNGRVVQVNWSCSRKIAGAKLTTESAQSMKTLIRNQ